MVSENKNIEEPQQCKCQYLHGFVRDSAFVIVCPLTHVINLSIIQGAVSDDLKSARVVPLLKRTTKLMLVIIGRFLF